MCDNVKKLEKEFKFRKNTYRQLEEGEKYYLYGVWNLNDNTEGEPSYYELFEKKTANPTTFPNGQTYPLRELYPSDNNFGLWAWCCTTKERVDYIKKLKTLF